VTAADEVRPSARSTPQPDWEELTMGRIVVSEFVSLDGVMESPGGGEGFKHDAWTFEFDYGDGLEFKLDETMSSDALLLGRVTYEGFADAWPSQEGDFADKLNEMPKYVVSSTLTNPEWNNSTVLPGDVVEAVTDLKRKHQGNVVVHGSARLVQTLLEHDLVDELRLMVFPVVLGAGKRLFAETTDKKRFRLVDTRTVGDGISILVLRPDPGGTDASH
jgi:dihydrofolate reductase